MDLLLIRKGIKND